MASRLVWCGKRLDQMTPRELQVFQRDLTWARMAIVEQYSEVTAAMAYDLDLEELAGHIASRPDRLQALPTPAEGNPFLGKAP